MSEQQQPEACAARKLAGEMAERYGEDGRKGLAALSAPCPCDGLLAENERLRDEIAQHDLWREEAQRQIAEAAERERGLREALAPFANRAAEKGMGGKYSALTDSQWRKALETYQECPGGDMCGCKPRIDAALKQDAEGGHE